MKHLPKFAAKHGYSILIVLFFLLGTFLRLYNFQNRLIFGPEQGISLTTSADNLTKFSLLGETNLQRATSANHIPFHGAYFSYLLLPFLILFNFRVLPMTYLFAFFNLFTALVFFLIVKKIFGKTAAAFSLFFFLTSAIMIHHSLFTWILNPLPLLGILSLYFVWVLWKNRRKLSPAFWLGFMSGFGFGLQNLYLPFGFILLILLLILSEKRLKSFIFYFFGAIMGNLPMVIFDLRHDFYHVRTMWQYFLDVYVNHTVSGFTDYYHFLYLAPLLFLLLGLATAILYRAYKPLAILPIAIFLVSNFSLPMFNLAKSTGMPPGLTLRSLESAADVIALDQPPSRFNVATLWDFDTRANTLRYLLKYNHHLTPQGYENYADVSALYVFAPADYDIEKPKVWELSTFLPYQVTLLPLDVPGYHLYKLTK